MSKWINNKKKIWKNLIKPCRCLGYCPYGSLVEEYPIKEKREIKHSCNIFGHDCPVFYQAEIISEEGKSPTQEERAKEYKLLMEEKEKVDKEIQEAEELMRGNSRLNTGLKRLRGLSVLLGKAAIDTAKGLSNKATEIAKKEEKQEKRAKKRTKKRNKGDLRHSNLLGGFDLKGL